MKETQKIDDQTTIMTRNHLARSTTHQHIQQTSPQQQQQPHQSVQHLQTKWSIKERLFLVSCVLINGESNWSFISDQLNKWMKHTSNYISVPFTNNLTILGSNSTYCPQINIRTNNQCSKQYKFIVKNYALKYGINDLKKVYNHLADERLKELKNLVLNSHQQFKDVYNEIEQILEMDTNNLEQLESIWQGLKNAESNLTKSNYVTRSANESLNKSSDSLLIDDEAEAMERNIEKIHAINRKKREEIEAAQRAAELAAAQEAARQQQIENEQMQLEQQESEPIIIDSVMSVETQQPETIEIKIEQNISMIIETEESKPKSPKIEQTDIKPETLNNELDKSSSEDEVPLVKLHQKNKKKDSETGIEWKPVIDNTTDETNQLKLNLLTDDEDESDEELSVKKPKRTFASPRKQLKVVESSSSSSDTENKTVTNTPPVVESPKNKVEEIQQPTPVAIPSRKSTRNRNSLSTSSNKEANKNDESELIFTPLIKYDKKEDSEKAELITKIDENEEFNSLALDKDEKESVSELNPTVSVSELNPTVSDSKNKRKSKNVKKIEAEESINETKTETDDLTLNISDEEETTEEQTTRVSTLRSKRGGLLNNSNQNTSKRRSSSIQKVTKSLIVSVNTPKTITADDSPLNELPQNKDAGLLSIKCEPVQISASSTVQDSESKDDNESSVLVTRSSRNKDSAPFSSSSTSSILSNNSSSSLINKFEDEKAYRAWKKSILMVLNNISCHKHATVFMHPVRDDIAPGYSSVVYRPMDLGTLKKNIENGLIKSTKEFQRDIMLMFTNAIMYNSSSHDVHKISIEMYKEVLVDVEQLLNAQEAMGEGQKPLRFKDKRSSTASDRGAAINDLDRTESNDTNSEPVVNILMTTKKENFSKDEALETASQNSSSSVSQTIISTITSSSTTTNMKKRRPSSESSQAQKETSSSKEQQPKSKKRRKSGR